MKNAIVSIVVLLFYQCCYAQKNNTPEFTYQRSFFDNGRIIENFIYDSKTGVYEYHLMSPGYEKVIKKTTVRLSDKSKSEIYALYRKLKPKNLRNCRFEKNQKTYSSHLVFKNINVKDSCNTNIDDELSYKKIEDQLYDFFSSSSAYREAFPEEFIKK